MKYICIGCGCVFDEPRATREDHGETFYGCPACGDGFREAFFCDACGDPIDGQYVELPDGTRYCSECFTLRSI